MTAPPPAASLETIQLEHVPDTHSVNVAVFEDVENAEFLQQQLLGRNAEYEYAFIDATSIVSRLQVLSAVYKAITTQLCGAMKTPNIHSEIVCSLSPNNNISEAYRRYGITPSSKYIIVVKVLVSSPSSSSSSSSAAATAQDDVERHLLANVRGRIRPFTDETLAAFTDWAKVRKYYKLNGVGWLNNEAAKRSGGKEEEEEGDETKRLRRREMEMLVLGSMALRGL